MMKTKTTSLGAISLLACFFCTGTCFIPTAFTLPDGLQSVNGSSSTGDCQPESCVMTPISGTNINACDCPNDASVNATLIDGVVSSIDTTQRETWASELFTVNRMARESTVIGFQFRAEFILRGVEVVIFHCPVRGIGIARVQVYSSFLFPNFIMPASTLLATLSSPPRDNCQSLSTISIPVQPMQLSDKYFIEFFFTGGSSVHSLNWLYLDEIRFSDQTPTTSSIMTTEIATENEGATITTLPWPKPANTTTTTTGHSPSTLSLSTHTTATTESVSITSDINSTSHSSTTQPSIATDSSHINALDFSTIPTLILGITTSESEVTTSNPTTITVATLAGVIGLLILLMVVGCALFLGFVCYRRHKSSLNEGPLDQYALPTELTLHEKRSSLSTAANSCYNKSSSRMTLELPEPPTVYCSPEIYSEVGIDGDSGLYDDIGNHYALIPETKCDKRNEPNMIIDDQILPYETRRLSKSEQTFVKSHTPSGEANPLPQVPLINETQVAPVGIYSQVGEDIQDPVEQGDYYTDMQGSRAASQLSICSRRCSSCDSMPLLQLSKPLGHEMDDNPTYNSAWSLLEENERRGPEEDTYTDPDARFHGGSQLTIYETVYSDSQVKSAIFKRNDAAQLNDRDISDTTEQGDTKESGEEEEEIKAMLMYSPIYLSHDALSPTSQKQPLAVTNDNIRGVKVLGTGFFGKVVLADTVGLSLKDLGLSESDDDKSTSVRVAVKKLKVNASKSTKEAFEKECRFMSRLDHPNVIHMLGVCTTDPSQFIMMEYMEKGDLTGYLNEYESIVHVHVAPKEGEILVSQLLHMCTQIAAAMKYLVSCNFIHRDLAARNCLVGDKSDIKLADFGMSRNLYESHYYLVQGNAVLPVRWMATECFYGKFSAKTDVWAFGVTMWEIFMLAKERPYSDMEDMEVVNDAIEKEERTLLQQPDHCPDDVFQVMMRCWAKEPKDRATFEELHAMLMQLNNNN